MIEVKHATCGDYDNILKLEDKFFQYDKLTKKTLHGYLKKDSSCLILSLNGETIGYALLIYKNKVAWLCSIAAEKGYGKYLLKEAENESRRRNCDSLKLEVRTSNISGIKFYEKHGYQYCGDIPNYYEDGCDALKFKKNLFKIGILYTPNQQYASSSVKTIQKFIKTGPKVGVQVEIVDRYTDYTSYNGLFIRDITRPDNYTYACSQRASEQGLVVIDDPQSIILCSNKIVTNELFKQHKIPTPKTYVINQTSNLSFDTYPLVVKIPDGSFSKGIHKVSNKQEMEQVLTDLFQTYNLLLVQEFLYTSFDWRIGVLNNKPLFGCQYQMVKGYWKIVKHIKNDKIQGGQTKTFPIESIPENVLALAVDCTKLIGSGLYGVDIKEKNGKLYVIEINDNPNIDIGIEDQEVNVYEEILLHFKKKIIQTLPLMNDNAF